MTDAPQEPAFARHFGRVEKQVQKQSRKPGGNENQLVSVNCIDSSVTFKVADADQTDQTCR